MSPDPTPTGTPGRQTDDSNTATDQMMGSLGTALAGVNLAGTTSHGFAFSNNNSANQDGSANYASSSNHNAGRGGNDGWGYDGAHHDNANTTPSARRNDTQSPPAAGTQRNEGFDLFLSQSPSQTLGADVFKLSSNNLPGLALQEEQRTLFPGGQSLAPGGMNAPKGQNGDSATGTATSSRSESPYDANRNSIGAYHTGVPTETNNNRQSSYADDSGNGGGHINYNNNSSNNNQSNHGHPHHPQTTTLDKSHNNPNMHSAYSGHNQTVLAGMGSYSNNNNNTGYDPANPSPQQQMNLISSPSGNQRQPHQQPPPANQQQQILYMAVPTADGRQVLQPVQMVQMPGKPFAYILPNGGTAGGQMMENPNPQQVMIMPGMQQGGLNSGINEPAVSGMIPGSPALNTPGNKTGGYSSPNPMDSGKFMNGNYGRSDNYASPGMNKQPATPSEQFTGASPLNPSSDNLSSLYSLPQRPPLDQLLGQVRRLSRDQVGCRLVQQALDEEGTKAATSILNEGLPFWGEAMVDPFGNYLFQKILEKISAEERIMLVKSVSTRLVNASLNLHGTRSVQKVVELCAIDEEARKTMKDIAASDESAADVLTRSLAPAAARLCIDSHGNHVIQRILLKLGPKHSKFIFDAVAESVGDVARHRHGCCVIQRCLDSPPSEARSHLVRRIVDKSLELMQDAYGNYVVQYVLDVCSDEDVHAVCESVAGKVNLLAIQKFSSNVMEKCLERCTDRVKELYLAELADADRVRELMMDPFGNYVIQRALSVATHPQAVQLVEAMRPHLMATMPASPNGQRNGGVRNTAGGRRIMAKISRRFPNFTLTPVGAGDDMYSQNKGHHHRHHHHHAALGMSPGVPPNMAQGMPPGMAPMYGNIAPGPPQNYQHYNANPHGIVSPARQHPMYDHQRQQQQAYYDVGQPGYVDHQQYMSNLNHRGGFSNGL